MAGKTFELNMMCCNMTDGKHMMRVIIGHSGTIDYGLPSIWRTKIIVFAEQELSRWSMKKGRIHEN